MPTSKKTRSWLASIVAAVTVTVTLSAPPAQAASEPTLPPGGDYVALGSSYAAGGGLGTPDPADAGKRCGRTLMAYPYAVARALDLRLTNATCGGAAIGNIATTPQVIWSWDGSSQVGQLQIDSVTADTDLVTITIGGNDVNYAGNLMAEACLGDLSRNPTGVVSNQLKQYGVCTPVPDATVEERLSSVESRLVSMIQTVRERAPLSRIVLVDYLTVLPENGQPCLDVPISQPRQKFLLEVARKLSLATKHAAQQTGVELVAASQLSRGHDACSTEPWVTGYDFSRGFVIMHPNEAGHAAVAEAIVRELATRGGGF